MSTQQLPLFSRPEPRKARSFHNRQPIPGPASEAAQEIKRNERKASKQDSAVLEFFLANPGRWAPSQVWDRVSPRWKDVWPEVFGGACDPVRDAHAWPIQSIRRSMTGLTNKGYLRITIDRIKGPWGAMEHLWELVPSKEGNQ